MSHSRPLYSSESQIIRVVGPVGPVGPTGIQGYIGFQGNQGIQGIQGIQGNQGIKGQGFNIFTIIDDSSLLPSNVPTYHIGEFVLVRGGNL